jgi:hypothetical protein
VDVAVLHHEIPDWADCIPIPTRFLVHPGDTHEYKKGVVPTVPDVGIGDIAYVVGLFNPVKGKKVNLPLVHTGHIAMLPKDERIPVVDRNRREREIEGYLVQAHVLDGASGAPIFARISYPIFGEYRPETRAWTH